LSTGAVIKLTILKIEELTTLAVAAMLHGEFP
jgi:hypothetical protein